MSISERLRKADNQATLAGDQNSNELESGISDEGILEEEFDAIYQAEKLAKGRKPSKQETHEAASAVNESSKSLEDNATSSEDFVDVEELMESEADEAKTSSDNQKVSEETKSTNPTKSKPAEIEVKPEEEAKEDKEDKEDKEATNDVASITSDAENKQASANEKTQSKNEEKSSKMLSKSLKVKTDKAKAEKDSSENATPEKTKKSDKVKEMDIEPLPLGQSLFTIRHDTSPEAAKKESAKDKLNQIVFNEIDEKPKNSETDYSKVIVHYTKTAMRILKEKPDSVRVPSPGKIEVEHKGMRWVDNNKDVEFFVDEINDDVMKRAVDAAIAMAVEKNWKTLNISDVHEDIKDLFVTTAREAGIAVNIDNSKPTKPVAPKTRTVPSDGVSMESDKDESERDLHGRIEPTMGL